MSSHFRKFLDINSITFHSSLCVYYISIYTRASIGNFHFRCENIYYFSDSKSLHYAYIWRIYFAYIYIRVYIDRQEGLSGMQYSRLSPRKWDMESELARMSDESDRTESNRASAIPGNLFFPIADARTHFSFSTYVYIHTRI